MAWTCMAASGTGSLVFINDVTTDRSSKMNSEVYRALLFDQICGRKYSLSIGVSHIYVCKV